MDETEQVNKTLKQYGFKRDNYLKIIGAYVNAKKEAESIAEFTGNKFSEHLKNQSSLDRLEDIKCYELCFREEFKKDYLQRFRDELRPSQKDSLLRTGHTIDKLSKDLSRIYTKPKINEALKERYSESKERQYVHQKTYGSMDINEGSLN
ncbi:MAG: hypothetical protein ACQEP1_05115 [Nanobdellota archaeon]